MQRASFTVSHLVFYAQFIIYTILLLRPHNPALQATGRHDLLCLMHQLAQADTPVCGAELTGNLLEPDRHDSYSRFVLVFVTPTLSIPPTHGTGTPSGGPAFDTEALVQM
ncbi:hypothetical protein EX30DRAFT_197046 [Ascodesmis nigricans]|uniref:Uncharacterized protein n=1 Tax=Ascodesmis nigricans TaxID=341454 RepID=A0A4S2MKK7_9PEZI|nr:hypothetical protein EX30DRAFT_197046 [Ascodesmis nigricans]